MTMTESWSGAAGAIGPTAPGATCAAPVAGNDVMAEYSPEQARRIIAGLASGKCPGHRQMSDAEFHVRYDPVGTREAQLLDVLQHIRDILLTFQQGFEIPKPSYHGWQDNKESSARKPAGPTEL